MLDRAAPVSGKLAFRVTGGAERSVDYGGDQAQAVTVPRGRALGARAGWQGVRMTTGRCHLCLTVVHGLAVPVSELHGDLAAMAAGVCPSCHSDLGLSPSTRVSKSQGCV